MGGIREIGAIGSFVIRAIAIQIVIEMAMSAIRTNDDFPGRGNSILDFDAKGNVKDAGETTAVRRATAKRTMRFAFAQNFEFWFRQGDGRWKCGGCWRH